jgi:hypothetical protein
MLSEALEGEARLVESTEERSRLRARLGLSPNENSRVASNIAMWPRPLPPRICGGTSESPDSEGPFAMPSGVNLFIRKTEVRRRMVPQGFETTGDGIKRDGQTSPARDHRPVVG